MPDLTFADTPDNIQFTYFKEVFNYVIRTGRTCKVKGKKFK